jgi:hypothetical protein
MVRSGRVDDAAGANGQRLDRLTASGGRILLSTELDREGEYSAGELQLRPDEGLVLAPDD